MMKHLLQEVWTFDFISRLPFFFSNSNSIFLAQGCLLCTQHCIYLFIYLHILLSGYRKGSAELRRATLFLGTVRFSIKPLWRHTEPPGSRPKLVQVSRQTCLYCELDFFKNKKVTLKDNNKGTRTYAKALASLYTICKALWELTTDLEDLLVYIPARHSESLSPP